MKNRFKAPVLAIGAMFVLSGCGLLDVDNPNSLVEESVEQEAAANGMVNGALQRVSRAISHSWEPYLMASDEMFWIGSRDAWLSLDHGFIADPENEFSDGAFPDMGQAVWTASNALRILEGHVASSASPADFQKDLHRAQMYNGLILMVVGEIQEDMTFSDKQTDGAPVGPANMFQVLDNAITNLQAAATGFGALGESALQANAMGLLARAQMSRAIWDEVNPTATGTYGPSAGFATAAATAASVLGMVSGDWQMTVDFSAGTVSCFMCNNVNDRKENQIDLSLVTISASESIDGISMMDPVSGNADLALIARLNQWHGGDYLSAGDSYSSLTVTSARMMNLIIAEHELSQGNGGPGNEFEDAINEIRDLDGEVDFESGVTVGLTDMDMLAHTRRVNLVLTGLRLADMYRWGLTADLWLPTGQTVTSPGMMLPVTLIEQRANCHYTNTC